jgi:hypothetical protein
MDRLIYASERQDSVFYNLFTYDRLVYRYMLLMEHAWLMNHGSITCGIIYGSESMKINYILSVYHLGEYVNFYFAS